MSNIELELTYLANKLPNDIFKVSPTRLVDIYIPEDPKLHSRLRIRQKGSQYTLTKKVLLNEGDASRQEEFDIPLDQKEFDVLSKTSNKRVVKDRYNIVIDGSHAEVDIFRDDLEGLVVIDFEFESEEEQVSFHAPKECLADVTQEVFIAGGNLAGKTYADIEEYLRRFKYKKLHVNETSRTS